MKTCPFARINRRWQSLAGSNLSIIIVVISQLGWSPTGVYAQSYQAKMPAIKSGGISQGGGYRIKGGIGLVSRGPAQRGDEYSLTGNITALVTALQSPELPTLRLVLTATNTVILTWTASATNFILEQNSDVNPAAWTGVESNPVANGSSNHVLLPLTSGQKFFRLRKP